MKQTKQYILWVLAVTIWTTFCFIMPDFLDNPIDSAYAFLLIASYVIICGIGSSFLIYLIGISKYLCIIIFPLWAITGAGLSFSRVGFHITLTPMLIDVIIHTNTEEALGVISWHALIWVGIQILIAIVFIWWRWKLNKLPLAWAHCLITLLVGSLFFNCNGRLKSSLCQRFPYSIPYNIHEYISLQHNINTDRIIPKYHITEHPDSLTIVLVLGESVRADHLQLNGYERETTPKLLNRSNLISFKHIYTQETHTLSSLPIILTRSDSIHKDYQYTETSFISIMRQSGYRSAWISNQDMGSSFSHFLAESDTIVFANAGKSVYVFSQWLDEELIPLMDSIFLPHPAHALYILHTIGSHWYYNNHIPETMHYYKPTTTNRVITTNTKEQIINSYDNTIRYLDFYLDSLISTLENQKAIVFFQSDHGESLGENDMFLHANDEEACKNPACIIWYSDQYAKENPEKVAALIANKDKHYRTDYVFYSILYAAGIEAEGDCQEINIFR